MKVSENSRIWTVETPGEPIELTLNRSNRARHLSLRVDTRTGKVVLTIPPGASDSQAGAFAMEKLDWIRRHTKALPPRVPLAAGSVIPFLGTDHTVTAHPGLRGPAGAGPVWREPGAIHVAGDPAHHGRRLRDWLIDEARRAIVPRARRAAEAVARPVSRITVRDSRTRWGSCSRRGTLSFSWRLVMAPEPVLDYMAAHEAAHLREMNHGPRFWRLVGDLQPDFETSESWLRRHGPGLHRYG